MCVLVQHLRDATFILLTQAYSRLFAVTLISILLFLITLWIVFECVWLILIDTEHCTNCFSVFGVAGDSLCNCLPFKFTGSHDIGWTSTHPRSLADVLSLFQMALHFLFYLCHAFRCMNFFPILQYADRVGHIHWEWPQFGMLVIYSVIFRFLAQ